MPIQLASLFQDHAVLQRGQTIPVWGWTTPLARVRVTLGGQEARTLSNGEGDFLVRLPALPAGGPHTLNVELVDSGESVTVRDLLVGEVWLASGQSNMQWTLSNCGSHSAADIARSSDPHLRFFTVETRAHLGPHRLVNGSWQPAAPATAGGFSAVAYYFARRLRQALNVPVGVISSAWGGTIIQTWISRSTLSHNEDMTGWLAEYEAMAWSTERWKLTQEVGGDGRISKFPKDPGNGAIAQGWAEPAHGDGGWSNINLPSTWQAAGQPYSGVFWFRRTVEIPDNWKGRDLQLHLGKIDKQDITYVNGVEVGRMGKEREEQFWNVHRCYTIPGRLVAGRTLTLTVRAYSFVYDGGMTGPAEEMRLHPADQPENACPLDGPWRFRCEHNLGVVTDTHVMGHAEPNSPHMLFDNMIQPLVPYALRGAIWYQGESNASDAARYVRLQQDLITDWRRHWGQPGLGFHLVQLPRFQNPQPHQGDSNWARLREAQTAALALPQVGMAVTIDEGEALDIHPWHKLPVGERLAHSALVLHYGLEQPPTGPLLKSCTTHGNTLRAEFHHADDGLITTDGAAPRLFYVAGSDGVFHPAEARIEGSAVLATSKAVPQPVALRYAWADNPEGANLANRALLPASPFRTDHG